MTLQRDAYQVLQVDPRALPEVIEAAYRALARLYHPDANKASDASRRMAELNLAYGAVRTPDRRKAYDRLRSGGTVSVVVGQANGHAQSSRDAANGAGAKPTGGERPAQQGDSSVIDFGRYQGWSIREIARHDPDYLVWLSRHSAGSRYRQRISEELARRHAARSA
jgi:DnaJ-class molecular chaperone